MIYLEDIRKEIAQILSESEYERTHSVIVKSSELSRRKKRLAYLNLVKSYMESNPTRSFLEKEKARIENRISLIDKGFAPSCKVGTQGWKDELKDYSKLMGVPSLKEQSRAISYILN